MAFIVVMTILILVTICGIGMIMFSMDRRPGIVVTIGGVIVSVGFWFFNAIIQVNPGEVKVANLFGEMVEGSAYEDGLHVINPLYDLDTYTTRREQLVFTSDQTLAGPAKGGVAVEIFDVVIPFRLNPAIAWKLRQRLGRDWGPMLRSAGRSAGRDTLANFTWEEASFGDRAAVAAFLQDKFSNLLVEDLTQAGLTEAEAEGAFIVLPVQIRNVRPPARILQANAEKAAAEVDLQRQEVLTRIAEQEAIRRGNEGQGVQNLIASLGLTGSPSPEEIAVVLNAMANKTQADAMVRAVEEGNIQLMVLPAGQSVAVR